jgi:hypothetical protein
MSASSGSGRSTTIWHKRASGLAAYSLDRLTWAVGELLQRAAAAGEIRADIDREDLLRALVGMCYTHDGTGWQAKVLRLVDVFIDGLRRWPDKRHDRRGCDADRDPKP